MPEEPKSLDSLSTQIGELRADSRRHNEALLAIAAEQKNIGTALNKLVEVQIELREYRHFNHERFNKLTAFVNETDDRFDEAADRRRELELRIKDLEHWRKQQIAAISGVGAVLATTIGWFSGFIGEIFSKVTQ